MPWKIIDGVIVMQDGNPVWENEDKTESVVDAGKFFSKINELNTEAKQHRLSAKDFKEKLESFQTSFKDIDADAARKALETVKNLDDEKMMTAEKVEMLKAKIKDELSSSYESTIEEQKKSFTEELTEWKAKAETAQIFLDTGDIERGISNSLNTKGGTLRDKTNLGNMRAAMGYFGTQFRRDPETGKMAGFYWDSDRMIISTNTENAGQPAPIEDCLKVLFENDPHRAGIAKDLSGGAGAQGGHGGQGNKKGEVSTKDFIKDLGFT